MVYLGLFPTAVTYVGYIYVLSRLIASRTVRFLYLVPAVAFLVEPTDSARCRPCCPR